MPYTFTLMETAALTRTIYNQWYVNEGKGRTVLLLHGLFGNVKMWSSTVQALKSNYRVIIPRLPLFDDHANLPFLVEVLHQFIHEHDLDDVIIVGHGVGSRLALLYAHEHPANVDRLVITGSMGFEYDFFIDENIHTTYNKIEHPVLLLWGLEDKITVPDVAMHFHDYLRNSVVHFIDKCGHVPMLEQPEDYNWHVTQFIKA